MPWKWTPDDQENIPNPKVRCLAEEEMIGKAAPDMVDDRKIYRTRLKKEEFVKRGFTQGCQSCVVTISGTAARGHSGARRVRMEKSTEEMEEGRERNRNQGEKENRWLADKI